MGGGTIIIGIDGRAAIWYRGTGIGTYVYQLINKMKTLDKKNKYSILLPYDSNYSFIEGDEFDCAVKSYLKIDKFWEELQSNEVVLDIHKNLDIYHIPQNGIGMPQNKSCSFVITLHDVIPITMPNTVGPYYRKKFIDSIPDILKKTNAIITVSEFSKSPDLVYVTKLAAEDIYKPLDKIWAKNYIRCKYGIEKDFILYVGGFNPRKNIATLLKSYAFIKNKLKKALNVVILGKAAPSYDNLIKICDDLSIRDDCIFTGYIPVNIMPYFYNAADIFVYPSLYEGFGLPVVEAMACGTPVITSNVTSLPEVAGDGAIKISPMDYETIGNSILRLLEDENLYNEMQKKALKQSSIYSWEKTAMQTINIYQIANNL